MTASTPNPYESPRADPVAEPPPILPHGAIGLWRQGDLLVMHEMTRFPMRCIASGAEAGDIYAWHVNTLFGTKPIAVPLSTTFVILYRLQSLLCLAAPVGCFMGSLYLRGANWIDTTGQVALILAGLILSFVWYAFYLQRLRLWATHGYYLWISGIHPDFLADLPEWPYRPM